MGYEIPPSRRLPPLNALRAFEAAARHLSFDKAARELHVTPGAISQQIKSLEDWLGVALFRRLPRGVLLNDAGQVYWPELRDAFDLMARATERLGTHDLGNVLTVSTMPSFAARWLIPRLGRLSERHAALQVRVAASSALTDFQREDVDVAIRFGHGNYPGLAVSRLLEEVVFPVCDPRLPNSKRPLRALADLSRHVLLHDEPDPSGVHVLDWAHWLAAVGAVGVDARSGPRFTYTHMTLQAAAAGQGVALGTSVLVDDDQVTGRLIRPLAESVKSPYAYYLVCPEATRSRPKIKAFWDWALGEAEITPGGVTS